MARRDETPRDLLFGLLALQNGLIDQDQLVAAFGAWSRAKGKTLAEILVERGSIGAEGRSILAAMAEMQLKLHGGDTEKSLAAVPAGPSTREKLAALGDAELSLALPLLGSATEIDDPYRTASHAIGSSTSEGQRFRILRPHARGGLGAVFVALDGELNREVALKEILDHHADDPISRARFLVEAEITGGLEHPGIVPVYGLGQYGDGRPYYAMRFIRGDSLKEAIASFHEDQTLKQDPGKRSLALRKLLRRFVDVCNAVDYAHGRGVLHRDIKPSNIIVGKHGETLVVDWGLAKLMGSSKVGSHADERTLMPSASSGSGETLPGSAIGTPAYMSPEQAVGDLERLGPRSDVYSLGATLYSLLTGNPPFEGNDLGTVLRDVQKGAFPPPRQVDPTIDRALEAICLKAMATRQEDRYATARALTDDVERWAADEPISAWREPPSLRARRWMRRHRTAVTAASAAVLVAVIGLVGVLAVQSQANRALTAKNIELDKANAREAAANAGLSTKNAELALANARESAANAGLREANERVQARFDLAREAIRSFQAGVNEDDMLKGEELRGLRNKLLRSAAGFYEKLEKLLQGQADRGSRAILAQSYFELSELISEIGIKPEALAVHRKALALRRELAASPDAPPGARLDLARSLLATGRVAEQTGDSPGALSVYKEARGLAAPLATGPGATEAAREILGNILQWTGWVQMNTGKRAEALESFRDSLAIRSKLVEDNPAAIQFHHDLADSHIMLGWSQAETGHPVEAMQSARNALEIYRKLVEDNPAVAEYRSRLAITHSGIGLLQAWTKHPAEALESYREALAISSKLVKDYPAVTFFRSFLAEFHSNIGLLHSQTGHPVEALESHRKALAIRSKLAEDNPDVPSFRNNLASSLRYTADLELQTGHLSDAMESYRRAIAITERLPMTSGVLYNLACCRSLLAGAVARPGSGITANEAEATALAARPTHIKHAVVKELVSDSRC